MLANSFLDFLLGCSTSTLMSSPSRALFRECVSDDRIVGMPSQVARDASNGACLNMAMGCWSSCNATLISSDLLGSIHASRGYAATTCKTLYHAPVKHSSGPLIATSMLKISSFTDSRRWNVGQLSGRGGRWEYQQTKLA